MPSLRVVHVSPVLSRHGCLCVLYALCALCALYALYAIMLPRQHRPPRYTLLPFRMTNPCKHGGSFCILLPLEVRAGMSDLWFIPEGSYNMACRVMAGLVLAMPEDLTSCVARKNGGYHLRNQPRTEWFCT